MDLERLKSLLLAKPGADEGAAFGPEHLTSKVGGKLYAVVSWDEDPVRISLNAEPDKVEAQRKVFPAVQLPPYFNKRRWNLVLLDGTVPEPELEAMIDKSYHLVVKGPTRTQRESLAG